MESCNVFCSTEMLGDDSQKWHFADDLEDATFPDPLQISLRLHEGTDGFVYQSIMKRLPEIMKNMLKNNPSLPRVQVDSLNQLVFEIANGGVVREIDDCGADVEQWTVFVSPYLGKTWEEAPWWFLENYFYRRIMEILNYYPSREIDPFRKQKRSGLISSKEKIASLAFFTENEHMKLGKNQVNASLEKSIFRKILLSALWGNQADLSMSPDGAPLDEGKGDAKQDYILINDVEPLWQWWNSRKPRFGSAGNENCGDIVEIVCDNAGFELYTDMVLAEFFLRSTKPCSRVIFHLKFHPTFVSDATTKDAQFIVDYLSSSSNELLKMQARRWSSYLSDGSWVFVENYFWNTPLPLWKMPSPLRQELSKASMVVFKGDAHYRRVHGDLDWDYTTPTSLIVGYFPVSMLLIRTMKGEVMSGLTKKQLNEVRAKDKTWLVNGKFGVIHWIPRD